MTAPKPFERRDPCAPVLRLGTLLSEVRQTKATGSIALEAGTHTHQIWVSNGSIAEVKGPKGTLQTHEAATVFSLQRPLISFSCDQPFRPARRILDPAELLVMGMANRHDLFEPVSFAERVPVHTLRIDSDTLIELRKLPFSKEEHFFFSQLCHPTPISMILWKRGLAPAHAAALLTTLNLLGVWKDSWQPGHLPKIHTAHQILKKVSREADDLELLGLATHASAAEIDKAFRLLSFELHPDRTLLLPVDIQQKCQQAFSAVSAAWQRLKQQPQRTSRRMRPVVHRADTSLWETALAAAEAALQQGNTQLARKHAISGLLVNPPPFARARFSELLQRVA